MRKITFFVAASLCASLAGCASGPMVSPAKLDAPTELQCLEIREPVSYSERRGLVGVTLREGLAPGIYRAEKADSDGVYYRGEGRAVWQSSSSVPTPYAIGPGGIWVPKEKARRPRIYVYIEAPPGSADPVAARTQDEQVAQGVGVGTAAAGAAIGGAIVRSIVKADFGKIMLKPELDMAVYEKAVSAPGPCAEPGVAR